MLRARQEGIEPQQLIDRINIEHRADFAEFLIGFDNYYSTHSDENRELANKQKEWFAEGLQDWDISRNAPY